MFVHDDRSGIGPLASMVVAAATVLVHDTEWILLAQDDAIVSRGVGRYIEAVEPPDGWLSLYLQGTRVKELEGQTGWCQLPEFAGAVAYLVRRELAKRFVSDPPDVRRKAGADSLVRDWCNERGVARYVHRPSLAQHIGVTRAIGYKPGRPWHEQHPNMTQKLQPIRRAIDFIEDAEEFLKN